MGKVDGAFRPFNEVAGSGLDSPKDERHGHENAQTQEAEQG